MENGFFRGCFLLSRGFLLFCMLGTGMGCTPQAAEHPSPKAPEDPPRKEAAPTTHPDPPLVAFLGDSLTAGLGLEAEEAYPARVQTLLEQRGRWIRIVNAGVSGDTSSGALARLDWVLRLKPSILVVAIGANDGLRGQPLEALERNLREIVSRARAQGITVLLAGQRLPTSYGRDYANRFAALYERVAKEEQVAWIPFLLEGVAMVPELNLPDGIHPNAAGHARIAERVAAALEPLLESLTPTLPQSGAEAPKASPPQTQKRSTR
jgi:acyl-CoA thioesterase-1